MSDNVVQFGDMALKFRASRSNFARAQGDCPHRRLSLDADGHVIRCDECSVQVEPFWALKMLSDNYQYAWADLERRERELAKLLEKHVVLKAALQVESAWRDRHNDPACPHCRRGIRPVDNFGWDRISKQMEDRRRELDKKP